MAKLRILQSPDHACTVEPAGARRNGRPAGGGAGGGLSRDEFLTVPEVAALLHVSKETVAYWVWRSRVLPSYGLGGGPTKKLRRIKRSDLEAFIARGYQPAVVIDDPLRPWSAGAPRKKEHP